MAPGSRPIAAVGETGQFAQQFASALNDRFRVTRTLGMGATGIVFEAYDREASEPIAIKMLHRIEPKGLLRLKREFRQLTEIAHPNLVGVHELFVEQDGRGFFTMDLVQGAASFLEYLTVSSTEDRLRTCLIQLVHGVQHLHSQRKLHRDLKPSNVLIDCEGRLRIVDFGLVASLHDQARPAADGSTFEGTPAYAAPEQIDGWRTTEASDWYAVGTMLYEVLAGGRPFEGSGRELLQRKAAEEPPPPVIPLGCALPPGLDQVCLRLLARDPNRRADGRDLLAVLGASDSASVGAESQPSAAGERAAAWPFVGREVELARLERAFSHAEQGGRPGGLLIEGSSGFGKTFLAQRFLDDLEASGRAAVLRGRCFLLESIHYNALDGILDALSDLLRNLPAEELESGLPSNVGALAQIFPVLNGVAAIERAAAFAPALQPSQIRSAALPALRELLAWLSARRPLVMFVDDLQWADADSARLLQDLLQAPLPSVWLLGTYRNDARTSSDSPDLERIVETADQLTLGPLGAPAVTELASRVLHGCPQVLALEIARKSGGDPLLVNELIRYAMCRGDLAALRDLELETALSVRLAGLSPAARHLLELVCVAGRRLPRVLLLEGVPAGLASLRELRLALAVRESIVADTPHVEPHHDRIRELVTAELSPARSRWLHRSLAERLRASGATYLDQVARHYLRAGMLEEAATIAEAAARDAARGYAFQSAADLLELALSCASEPLERQRLRVAAALACACAGRLFTAAEHYEHAAEEAADPAERGELRLQALTAYCVSGHGQKSRELLARSATELGVAIDFAPMSFGRGLWWMARLLLTATPRLRRSPGRSVSSPPTDPALRLLWQTTPALMVVDPELSCQFAVRAMIRAAEQGEAAVYGQSLSFQLALFVLVLGRRSALLERRFEQAHKLAQLDGDVWGERFVRVMRACSELMLGELERTLADCMDVARAGELGSTFAASVRSSARGLVIPTLCWLGRVGELARHIEPWLQEALDTGDRHLQITCRVLGSQRFLRTGDSARARREIDAARAIALDYTHQALADPWWRIQIELYDGQPERGYAIYEESLRNRPAFVRHCAPLQLIWLITEAQCVAALAASGIDRSVNIGRLEQALRLAKRYSSCANAPATIAHMAATLAYLRGQTARAVQQLRAAGRGYEQRGMQLMAAAMQLALARLEPSSDGTSARTARAVFSAEGIREPERWAYMIAPALLPGPAPAS